MRITRLRASRHALACLALAAATWTGVSPASADPEPTPTVEAGTVEAETTDKITGAELIAASDDTATSDERAEAEADLLVASAQDGVLYDAAEVQSAVVDDVTTTWVESVDVDKVIVSEAGEEVVGLGTIGENVPDAADVALAQMGSEAASSVGGKWGDVDGGTVRVTVDGYKLTSGWER